MSGGTRYFCIRRITLYDTGSQRRKLLVALDGLTFRIGGGYGALRTGVLVGVIGVRSDTHSKSCVHFVVHGPLVPPDLSVHTPFTM